MREAARIVRGHHVAPHVKALVVPGSVSVQQARPSAKGSPTIFREAGFEWRGAGCSMCLGMNPDKLEGNQVCAASSNRNFKGRQGSPTGRTLLMSPAMVAAAAVAGEVTDVRERGQLMRSASLRDRHPGAALPLRGNDIDTDRIMPARFLRAITFDGLEQHVFEDDRKGGGRIRTTGIRSTSPAFRARRCCVVNANFGCGSSREHAPQGLQRWGIHAVVGESFAEIFFGNSVMIGLPCVTASPDEVRR